MKTRMFVLFAACLMACSMVIYGQIPCDLYPIAVDALVLDALEEGDDIIDDILNGMGTGNKGWLSWSGAKDANALARSLSEPDSPSDIAAGDWIQGATGVKNSNKIRAALDQLVNDETEIIVPVYSESKGTGAKAEYKIEKFIKVQLLNYRLSKEKRISARLISRDVIPPCLIPI